jgi:hypothetical protein
MTRERERERERERSYSNIVIIIRAHVADWYNLSEVQVQLLTLRGTTSKFLQLPSEEMGRKVGVMNIDNLYINH